jgi:hypothetical protein
MKNLSLGLGLRLLLPLLVLTLIFGCKKEDESENEPLRTKFDLLTSNGWRITNFLINGTDSTAALFSTCELDNIFNYNSNYTYSIDEGPTKCQVGNPQIIETGVWAFANNQNLLVLEPGSNSEATYTILELTNANLKLEESFYDSTIMSTVTYTIHFVKS